MTLNCNFWIESKKFTCKNRALKDKPFCNMHQSKYTKVFEKPADCCICLEQLTDSTNPLIPCGHWVHLDCIYNSGKEECPICRTKLELTEAQRAKMKRHENYTSNPFYSDNGINDSFFRPFIQERSDSLWRPWSMFGGTGSFPFSTMTPNYSVRINNVPFGEEVSPQVEYSETTTYSAFPRQESDSNISPNVPAWNRDNFMPRHRDISYDQAVRNWDRSFGDLRNRNVDSFVQQHSNNPSVNEPQINHNRIRPQSGFQPSSRNSDLYSALQNNTQFLQQINRDLDRRENSHRQTEPLETQNNNQRPTRPVETQNSNQRPTRPVETQNNNQRPTRFLETRTRIRRQEVQDINPRPARNTENQNNNETRFDLSSMTREELVQSLLDRFQEQNTQTSNSTGPQSSEQPQNHLPLRTNLTGTRDSEQNPTRSNEPEVKTNRNQGIIDVFQTVANEMQRRGYSVNNVQSNLNRARRSNENANPSDLIATMLTQFFSHIA